MDGGCKSFSRVSAHRPTAAASDKRILLRMILATSSRERNMRTWRLPLLVATAIFGASAAAAAETQIERGKYLVTISGCGSCHTPGALLGKPDLKRTLAGSEVGFGIPGVGGRPLGLGGDIRTSTGAGKPPGDGPKGTWV